MAAARESGAIFHYAGAYRSSQISSCILTVDDLKRLYDIFDGKTKEAAERAVQQISRQPETPEEEFQQFVDYVRNSFETTITIQGAGGEQIVTTSREALGREKLPPRVNLLSYDNSFKYRLAFQQQNPADRFTLNLDFTKPAILNLSNPANQPTVNASGFEVVGSNGTWVTGVYQEVLDFLASKRLHRNWLHSRNSYDILLLLFGLPVSLWVVYRAHRLLAGVLATLPDVLRVGILIYVFMTSIYFFRIGFNALRWAFPLVEFECGSSLTGARRAIGAVILAVVSAFVYDVLKFLLS